MKTEPVVEAYARLKALRDHVPGGHVHAKYVTEFHEILELLEHSSGVNLVSFRIPDREIGPVPISVNLRKGEVRYSKQPYRERAFFEMRVDGVLNMFKILMSSGGSTKPPVGFKPPK